MKKQRIYRPDQYRYSVWAERGGFQGTMYRVDQFTGEDVELFTVDTEEAEFLGEEGVNAANIGAVLRYYDYDTSNAILLGEVEDPKRY